MNTMINNAERAAYAEGFGRTEITKDESGGDTVTTVYAGRCLSANHQADSDPVWDIRRTVVTEQADGTTDIEEKWATERAAWTDRATLTYKYR